MTMRLSEAQKRFLRRCSEFEQEGLPLPCDKADQRSHSALLYNGMIAITWGGGFLQDSGYVLTPAGRRALEGEK